MGAFCKHPWGFREAVGEDDFEKMSQAEFPWRLVTVMSLSQRRMGFFKPQCYMFPPWSQPLS